MINKKNPIIKAVFLFTLTLFLPGLLYSCKPANDKNDKNNKKLGLFVHNRYKKARFYTGKKSIDDVIKYSKKINADTLFVHVYIGDNCYFDNGKRTSRTYKLASEKAGCDLLDYMLDEANKSGIKCYAWFNLYAFTPGRHTLLKKYGKDVLTRDQYNRPYDGTVKPDGLDKFYRRDNLAWLEPGDPRVQDYLFDVLKKLVSRYPRLEGIQFDFIRYPVDPPFIPGGRYMDWGYSTGYGKKNIARFMKKHKFYPGSKSISCEKNKYYSGLARSIIWDQWRRDQITSFVIKSKKLCDKNKMKLTASVFAYADRVYFHGFQNWRQWIRKGHVDFVILMNYHTDSEMIYHIAKQHTASYPGKVWNALGAYVMTGHPEILQEQMKDMNEIGNTRTVLFEYFQIKDNEKITNVARKFSK